MISVNEECLNSLSVPARLYNCWNLQHDSTDPFPTPLQVTIELKEVFCGTELHITQEGVPAIIPAEACYMGWQESLILLAQLVEPEIPDQP